jgi:hypothetical protein
MSEEGCPGRGRCAMASKSVALDLGKWGFATTNATVLSALSDHTVALVAAKAHMSSETDPEVDH